VIESAARGVQFLLAVGIAYLIALWFAMVAWTFRDIEARSRSVFTQVFSTLLVVLFFIPGLLLYLILRPKETLDQAFQRALEEEYLLQDLDDLPLCRGCQRAVDPEFVVCPHCQTRLRGPCPGCARLIDLRWSVCPYCALSVERTAIEGHVTESDTFQVLEDARSSRRSRAVAAAAHRVGIDGDELDALTDALASGNARPAVAAGGSSLSRRIAAIGELTRVRTSGLRGSAGETDEQEPDGGAGSRPDGSRGVRQNGGEHFWADPLLRPGQTKNRPPDERS
jgi:double zinc ribbon protein